MKKPSLPTPFTMLKAPLSSAAGITLIPVCPSNTCRIVCPEYVLNI